MLAPQRQKIILETLSQNGAVTVASLSESLGVTEETVRRDLEKLEKSEHLRRTHGGALPMESSTQELSLGKRKATNVPAKRSIAAAAAKFISAGDTVFIDASTTTFFLADEIKKLRNVTVITNSLRVCDALVACEGIKVLLPGGTVSANSSIVGGLCENSIAANFFANKMFFSGKAARLDAGILESNEGECAVKKVMLKNSIKKYFLCDETKLGQTASAKLAPFSDIDCFICDSLPADYRAYLTAHGVDIVETGK